MTKIKLIVLFLCIMFTSCAKCTKTPGVKPNGNDTTNVVNTKDTIPEWLVVDTMFIENCTTYCSKYIVLDTNSTFCVFPFVVKDKNGESGLFAIVSLKRYDMLYINQLAMMDENDYVISGNLLTRIGLKDNYESMLFMFGEVERDALLKMNPNFTFNAWGMFGSVQQKLDSVQSYNLIELAKLTK